MSDDFRKEINSFIYLNFWKKKLQSATVKLSSTNI